MLLLEKASLLINIGLVTVSIVSIAFGILELSQYPKRRTQLATRGISVQWRNLLADSIPLIFGLLTFVVWILWLPYTDIGIKLFSTIGLYSLMLHFYLDYSTVFILYKLSRDD